MAHGFLFNILCLVFSCGEADNSNRDEFFFLLLLFNESSKEIQNSPNKHGSICTSEHRLNLNFILNLNPIVPK